MIKSSADVEYRKTKDSIKGRDYSAPFISFYNSSKNGTNCKTMCLSYNAIEHMGFPERIDTFYDDETNMLTIVPAIDGKLALYKFANHRAHKNTCTITRFLDYCGLNIEKYKGRYYGKIVDGAFVCELYEK